MKRNKHIKSTVVYLTGIVLLCAFYAFSGTAYLNFSRQIAPPDSITSPGYIKRLITYNKIYPFVRYNQNYIEWNDFSAISDFFNKIKQTPSRKLRVLHIGDSHVQADIFTGYIRNEMQNILGDGGRGFVFPYAAAETHAAYDYVTSCTGKWTYSRNIQPLPAYDLGITGATVHTKDSSASFRLVFCKSALKKDYNVLKIYYKCSPESYDLKLKLSGSGAIYPIDCSSNNDRMYVEINITEASDTLEFLMNKTDTVQNFFECYGLLLETNADKGILYNSVGINGAGLKSILKENLLLYQLSDIKPDLVVLDIGLNDFYKASFDAKKIEENLSCIIDIIQRASPETSIILSDGQDVYYKNWDEVNCKKYAELSREIAFRKGCAFYNYYFISGGQYSMLEWLNNKLARSDKVHLTNAGYILRGELFLNALLNSYYMSLIHPEIKTLIAQKEFPDTTKTDAVLASKNIPEIKDTGVTSSSMQEQNMVWKTEVCYYKIKNGDNLSTIAHKYSVTITQLKTWNSIKNSTIKAGDMLVIYIQKLTTVSDTITQTNKQTVAQSTNKAVSQTQTPPKQQANNTTVSNAPVKGVVKYVVKKGDNLWKISQKYNTTTDRIKKLNNLKSDVLTAGMVLTISK